MDSSKDYYRAAVACRVCNVTPRMLDYWVTTDVVQPSRVFEYMEPNGGGIRRKAYHLFDFRALVQIKIVKELRGAGISLQRVRFAVAKLRREHGDAWQSVWIVTDGKKLYQKTTDSGTLRSLAKMETGQLVFSVIALGAAAAYVKSRLNKYAAFPYRQRKKGKLKRWSARTISA